MKYNVDAFSNFKCDSTWTNVIYNVTIIDTGIKRPHSRRVCRCIYELGRKRAVSALNYLISCRRPRGKTPTRRFSKKIHNRTTAKNGVEISRGGGGFEGIKGGLWRCSAENPTNLTSSPYLYRVSREKTGKTHPRQNWSIRRYRFSSFTIQIVIRPNDAIINDSSVKTTDDKKSTSFPPLKILYFRK